MKNKILIPILIFFVVLLISCVAKSTDGDQRSVDSETEPVETAPVPEPDPELPPPDLPFYLIIDGMTVPDDMQIAIHSVNPVEIQVISSESSDSELIAIHPDATTIPLGSWSSETAVFQHAFPYGENHLLVKWGDSIYDILVVSAAPENSDSGGGCDDAFMELNANSSWRYRQTFNGAISTFWQNRVGSWTESDEGIVSLTIETGMEGGVEQNFMPLTTIDLYCADNILYITSAVEIDGDATWTTTYDDSTIYLPSELTEGSTWSRHGTILVESPDGSVELNLVERLQCTGVEQIAVEAGEFNAYRIEFSIERSNDLEEIMDEGTSWYVAGLGRVLSLSGDGSKSLELVSYEGTSVRME